MLDHLSDRELQTVIDFRDLTERQKIWQKMTWRGVPIAKTPEDCWLYQEAICELKPDLIVELGTHLGGSALFFADILELVGRGTVISVDKLRHEGLPRHDRIDYLTGNVRDDAIIEQVCNAAQRVDGPVLVIEDSLHTPENTAGVLEAYHSIVTQGSWFVIEDCGWPDQTDIIQSVIRDFIAGQPEFTVDESKGKFLITLAPGGWIKRIR